MAMKTIQIKTKKMETGNNKGEYRHIVWFNVVINGKRYELENIYDIENYLVEANWIGKQHEDITADEFTEKYTLDMITGTREKRINL